MKYSIIIPIYNGEQYIDRCLSSIIKQTYKNYEVIIVNDGSTDKTLEKLNEYVSKNKQIKIFSTKNEGVSHARNYGIEKISGDYFLFVDIDDYIDSNMLSYIDDKINKQRNIDVVRYDYLNVIDENNIASTNEINGEITTGNEAFIKFVNKKVPFDLTCIYAFKKSFWDEFNFKFELHKYHEDFGLIPYVIMKACRVLILNKTLYYYVQSNNSITRNNNYQKQLNKFNDILYHFDNLYEKVNKDNNIKKEDKKIFNSYIANAVLLGYRNLMKKDRRELKKEIKNRNIINMLLADNIVRKIKKVVYKLMYN